MNPDESGTSFEEFARKTLLRANMLIRAVAIKTFSAIIKDTPVGDPDLWQSSWLDTKGRATVAFNPGLEGYVGGRLRANWNCSIGQADTATTDSTEHTASIPKVEATAALADRNSVVWLSNSLPYVSKIEYEGHSRQAPAGMVRRNVARIKANLAAELRKIKATT